MYFSQKKYVRVLLQHNDNNHEYTQKKIIFLRWSSLSSLQNCYIDFVHAYIRKYTYQTNKQQQQPVPQTGPPRITFKKRQFFIGEKLIANCTTSKAQPAPHITWLINGKKVNFILLFIYMYIRI